jgi:polar amino acid transport system substrate-binding protein
MVSLRTLFCRSALALAFMVGGPGASWSASPAASSAASAPDTQSPTGAASPAGAQSAVAPHTTPPGVLRVAVKPAKPFAYEEGGQWKGYSVDLWNSIAQKNKWQFEWVPMETVPQTIEAVQNHQVDLALGALSITEEREKVIDFTHPFFESGLQIVTHAGTAGSIWVALEGLMSAPVLGGLVGLLAALIVVSWLLWRFERKSNPESFPEPMGAGLKESLWWSTNILIAGGCENISPSGTPGRLVAVVWMLGGIAFTSYITAVFTSTLTADRMSSSISNLDDLKGQLVGTLDGSSSDAYLSKEGIPLEGHDSVDSVMGALVKHDVKAVVYDAPLLRYWLITHPHEADKLVAVGETFAKQHYGFAMPLGSGHRKEINETLLELRSNGYLEELDQRWFGKQDKNGS